jgi:hypothetical protein
LQASPQAAHQNLYHATAAARGRKDGLVMQESRTYCRRIRQQHILVELRSGKDRRHNQQGDGPADHIDEEV